jgi:S-adenosylmethionine synthetase
MKEHYLWTTEAVSAGHPDKVADQISDAILDSFLEQDKNSHVACETMVTQGCVILGGEVSSNAEVDFESVVRRTLIDIGYDCEENCFDAKKIEVQCKLHQQSSEINSAVSKGDDVGAGDQGLMFGYATNTPTFMPLGHLLAFKAIKKLEGHFHTYRHTGKDEEFLLPDAKTQVTMEYNGFPKINTIVVSTSHKKMSLAELTDRVFSIVIDPLREEYSEFFKKETNVIINPGGVWTFCGPSADTGLTGRKLVVDNYGPYCPIGGGCFSGKDPSKVDRSAAYAARYVAKNIVAAELSNQAQVQLSYAIGLTKPVSLRISADKSIEGLDEFVFEKIDLSPKGIIERFNLKRPIYFNTASGGHFGNKYYPWEKLDFSEELKTKFSAYQS